MRISKTRLMQLVEAYYTGGEQAVQQMLRRHSPVELEEAGNVLRDLLVLLRGNE